MKYVLLFILVFQSAFSFCQFGFESGLNSTNKVLHRQRIKDWKEIPSERTIHSSSYIKSDGQIVYYYSREAVNYFDSNGQLQPVSTLPIQTQEGWHALTQKNPFSIYKRDGSIVCNGITVSKQEDNIYEFFKLISDTLVLTDQNTGIEKWYQFRNNGIKYSYVLNQPSSVPGDFVVYEKIILPSKYYNINHDKESGFIFITNEKNENKMSIAPIWCYDGNGKSTGGEYQISKISDTEFQLKLIVDESYFQQSLQYPVTVDPLVIGPTTTWTGGTMPSCFTPNYNVDSIQITVPSQISVTNLNVTSNYYASPFTTTVMADGKMHFSTDCNFSTTFTVAPPTGSSPGTAYLDDYNLNSPLMCCFDPQCGSYSFYLRMHLQRTTNGNTCNATYLYYDPTSIWPFSAYVMGYTVENYGAQALILNPTICSDQCQIQLRTYSHYGVAPYVVTHPWLAVPDTAGVANGCNSAITIQVVTLDIPNCPVYCDTTSVLTVPAPTVTDACGNIVSSWPDLEVNLKPTPHVSSIADTFLICSNANVYIPLDSCLNGANLIWFGNSLNGTTGPIVEMNVQNSSTNYNTINYYATAELNGCTGDTSVFIVMVEPNPIINFYASPDPAFVSEIINLTGEIISPGTISNWEWIYDGTTLSTDSIASILFTVPGDYLICLSGITEFGCTDTICKTVSVIPHELILPNIITSNGDGQNDFLSFQYLEFFESNHLTILNRWGNILLDKENYQNDWSGADFPEGVYYFILKAEEKIYSGYFHLMK